jgi:type I restriction enzyme M protein
MSNNDIVQKLWNLCDVLRDDGINYSDYVTELVLLLFIKMVHENTENGVLKAHTLPEGCRWTDLNAKSGINLLNDYRRILLSLSTGKDALGNNIHEDPLISAIYADAQTRLREPRHLEQLVKSLDNIQDWFSDSKDGLGDLYEGLLQKNATETKSGAGQYFTPRDLIDSMVRCIKPKAGEVIQDPAAGTAGFLIAAHRYIKSETDDLYKLTIGQQQFQKNKAYLGVELVPGTRRLALMNCLLHGMEGDEDGVIHLGNSLGQVGANLERADIILANPPFGTSKGGDASISRDDLTFDTSNKQLAFLQHIYRNLKPGGRAAVILPDNVLFEGGRGTEIRTDLMNKCNLHTILRLPTGIFYAAGVKTNVLFFTKGSEKDKLQEENCTENTWFYDLRSNMTTFGKRTPFSEPHLLPFEKVYGSEPKGTAIREEGEWSFTEKAKVNKPENSRWRCFSRDYIRDTKKDSLDISWIKDKNSVEASDLDTPEVLAGEAMSELTLALAELDNLMNALGVSEKAKNQKENLKKLLSENK